MRRNIRISMSSGRLNVYLPEEATVRLGGVGATVSLYMSRTESGEHACTIVPRGPFRISDYPSGFLNGRVTFSRSEPALESASLSELASFGVSDVQWSPEVSDGVPCVSFLVPQQDKLPAPLVRKPRIVPLGSRRSAASAAPLDPHPHESLRALLTTLNAMLASGQVSDVELTAVGEKGEGLLIRGPIRGRRIEEFG